MIFFDLRALAKGNSEHERDALRADIEQNLKQNQY